MKAKTVILFLLVLAGPVLAAPAAEKKEGELLAVITYTRGEVSVEHAGGKSEKARLNLFLQTGDVVVCAQGTVNIQLGPSAVIHMDQNSRLELADLSEGEDIQKVLLKLGKGQVYSKIVSPLGQGSSFRVVTTAITAGVRGTEFMVSADTGNQKIPEGVYVNDGVVKVDAGDEKGLEVSAGQQIALQAGQMRQKILDDFVRKKMEIFAKIDVLKEQNYRMLKEQKERNQKAIENILQKTRLPEQSENGQTEEK